MGAPRQLSNPPIKEALIDIRTASEPAVDIERLKGLQAEIVSAYPAMEEQRAFKAQLRVEGGKVLPPGTEDLGFAALVFSSVDKTRLVQIRRDGFTVNHVGGYTTADSLISEALRIAALYWSIANPVAVTRIAMRYINGMTVRYEVGDDFRRYLTAPPDMPEGSPQDVSSFLSRMVAHDGDDVVIVTQKLDDAADGTTGNPVTLDIDAFYPLQMDADIESLRRVLARLRLLKNRTFFALLTDEALRLYE